MATISRKTAINSKNTENTVFTVNNRPKYDASNVEFYLNRVGRQLAVLAYPQVAVLVSTESAGLMTIETHCNIVEHRCFMTVRGFMDIVPGKPFYVFILNTTANPVNLPNCMTVAYASSSPACMTHPRDDELTC